MVRWALKPADDGGAPKMRFLENSLVAGRDQSLSDALAPCCTEEEFPGFVWMKQSDGRAIKEMPDPSCADHGLDATRYAAMFAWKKDLSHQSAGPMFEPGSIGDVLNYEQVYQESH